MRNADVSMLKIHCLWSAIVVFGCLVSQAQSETPAESNNWNQWRGPNADGVAVSADPPVRWSESENIKWKVEIPGQGSATPIVWGQRIYVVTAIKTDRQAEGTSADSQPDAERQAARGRRGFGRGPKPTNYHQFVVRCLDRGDGQLIWEQVAVESVPHEGHHPTGTFASCSPVTDGDFLYVSFGSRGIYCYDLNGNLQWKRDLGDMHVRNSFGEGGSPALAGEALIVPWDHEGQSSLFALNAKTGETKWRVDRDEPTTWATPLVVRDGGRQQVIMNGSKRVRSYDASDGSLIWECGGQAFNPVASPIRSGDLVYCTTGRRGFMTSAMPLSASGDITETAQIAWQRNDSGAYVSSPLIYRGYLYHIKGTSAVLSCLDAGTGEAIFEPGRLPGLRNMYASPVAAADRIYFTDRNGSTLVVRYGDELDVLATNHLDEGSDASLVLVDNEILLRGNQHLYCIGAQ